MRPRAQLGLALLLLGGCSTANQRPDVQLPEFVKGPSTAAADPRGPAPTAVGTAMVPATVTVPAPNGSSAAPVAQYQMNLPVKIEMQPGRPGYATQGPFGPVQNVGSSRSAAADRPAMAVLNSTAKQPPPPVPPEATMTPPPPTPPESSPPIVASVQDPPPGDTIERDLARERSDNRLALSDILGRTSRSPEQRLTLTTPAANSPAPSPTQPVGYDAPPAPLRAQVGATLSVLVEDDNPTPPPVKPPVAEVPPAPAWPTPAAPESATVPTPVGPEIRLVNSKRIRLDYEVKDVGKDGASDVDLWYTRDGWHWKKKEMPPQGRPPCVVDVEDEDLYGFTLVVHRSGSPGRAPQEGDRPQVWVEVDVTKPTVWLLDAEAGRGPEGRQVTIRWKAADKNLSPRPITLSYAPRPEGPWLPFASQLENTGRYVWQVPRDIPARYLVRVEAVDLAGNVGQAQTAQALGEESAQPTTAILKVEGAR